MSDITNERWAEVVKNSPYVFLTDEVDSYSQEVTLYALDEYGGLDESKPIGSILVPNLYFEDTKSPFKYFMSRTAFYADTNYIGEFSYSTYDYDTDYPDLEDTGFNVVDLEELEELIRLLIPEKRVFEIREGKGGGGMNKEERLAKVWERRHETVTSYRSLEDGLEVRTGYDLAKLIKLLKEYDLTVEDFQEYGRRMKEVHEN